MQVILAQPRGHCAGVRRAIEIVETSLAKFGSPIYVRHQIVHNPHVVQRLAQKGVIFVKNVDEVPENAVIIFNAHGVSEQVEAEAMSRNLKIIDATCPLVSKVHTEGQRYAKKGFEIILIGHKGHPEVEGTLGRIPGTVHLVSTVEDVANLSVSNPEKLAYVSQTTLNVDDTKDVIDALQAKFPQLVVGTATKYICYATQNRQAAVKELAKLVDVVLVIGAHNSSNSTRLRESAESEGIPAYLINDASHLNPKWLEGKKRVGITAGTSAPEDLIQGLLDRLNEIEPIDVSVCSGVEENIHFRLPFSLTGA
ncbi:MAG: 4-hydroxy-3-methylbut-2-enyl diphosphate reductase [Alphaproteobacteria bacterium]|nr:4-hydroxy-3-methylbut-2-enyl diphosphate reductase [Alphaproteobacteria bacterium]MCL2504835.1 4-hydroxy-3-methylbut-2-enyl diphosphate reductase [Alphaproteobacteria bacterium]